MGMFSVTLFDRKDKAVPPDVFTLGLNAGQFCLI
jgi:hypothetical protein